MTIKTRLAQRGMTIRQDPCECPQGQSDSEAKAQTAKPSHSRHVPDLRAT